MLLDFIGTETDFMKKQLKFTILLLKGRAAITELGENLKHKFLINTDSSSLSINISHSGNNSTPKFHTQSNTRHFEKTIISIQSFYQLMLKTFLSFNKNENDNLIKYKKGLN